VAKDVSTHPAPTNGQVGPQALTLAVRDLRGAVVQQSFTVTVANVNDPPRITSVPIDEGVAGAAYAYDARAEEIDLGDTLTWALLEAPPGMSIDAGTGAITWATTSASAGTHDVEIEVRDAANATHTQSFELEIAADAHAPLVTVIASPDRIDPGQTSLVTVLAIDDAAVTSLVLTVDGGVVPLDGNGQYTFTASTPGAHALVATATDPSGNAGVGTGAIGVTDPADTTAPTVSISQPAEDAELTFVHDVVGTVQDPNLLHYRLLHQRIGETAEVEFARGHAEALNAALGSFDTTLLRNGYYRLILEATDVNGRSARAVVPVRVDGGAKVGIFRISFVDLSIPMAGIPLTVVRSYDSRVKTQEDFGHGWELDISAGEVMHKVEFDLGWVIATLDDPLSFPCTVVLDQTRHLTEIRVSERERYVFRPVLANTFPYSGGCRADVGFELVDGTTPNAELAIIGPIGVRAPGAIIDEPTDTVSALGQLLDEAEGTPFEPKDFQLTTEDGRVIDLREGVGITRIEDRNGNELFINENGLVHSAGETIHFTRDTQGRITKITDPMGHELEYGYDAAGDLISFENQTDDTTTFTYGDSHDLLEIHDPNGVRAAQ
jgi:YD repeat-containing protein